VKAALFLGCSAPVRAQNYEASFRLVADALGIELVDILEFGCCGYPAASIDDLAAAVLAARNLALAEAQDLDLITLCSACLGSLASARERILKDDELKAAVDRELDKIDLKFEGKTQVIHAARVLYETVGAENIKRAVKRPLEGLKVAVHYGCHYLKPGDVVGHTDNPEAPVSLDEMVRATGAETLEYAGRLGCCGGGILGVSEETALNVTQKRLQSAFNARADCMVTVCPFCSVMLEGNQKKIEKQSESKFNLPVLYLPQLIGLSLGLDPDALGFKLNRVKAKKILAEYSPDSSR